MSKELSTALRQKKALVGMEEYLLKKARSFFMSSFGSKAPYSDKPLYREISASQMASIGNRLQTANGIEEAKQRAIGFLQDQLKKLEAKEKRTGNKSSWLLQSLGTGGKDPIGQTLIRWIDEQKYLVGHPEMDRIDTLIALRRFWSNVHGLYRYAKSFGTVPLEEKS